MSDSKILSIHNLAKTILFLGALIPLFIILFVIVQDCTKPQEAQKPPANYRHVVRPGLPVRLKIPKINIDTGLEHVGLNAQGELGIPSGPVNAAWYNLGPRPGERGSSVIDGHFGWHDGIPAVFDKLHELQVGDVIYVDDDKGKTYNFVVKKLQIYGQSDDASTIFRSNDKRAHLNLITCQGVWNQGQQSYSTRLVVFADESK